MAHPRMYDDDDPVLARLREVALAFPEATEVESHGRPTFRAGKVFGVYGSRGGRSDLVFKPAPGERDALVHERRMSIPPYYGPSGWLAFSLEGSLDGEVDWEEVRELLEDSYRQVALKRMLTALDART